MGSKFNALWKNELLALGKDDKDKAITVRNDYPKPPIPCFEVTEGFDLEKVEELMLEREIKIAKSMANDIIIPDPAPKFVGDAFLDIYAKLEHILVKDSVRCFLRFFENCEGQGMSSYLTITAQTLTFIVGFNALRCAKVVLEGMAPELYGMHANPNCINKYGYFVLHEAAERFSVDMIKLLLCHGASANVRTVGNDVIENLLPLHVAVENTCLHKYLEDNLEDNPSRSQNHEDYVYKLIHLLCLPEMKIFLDTIRLLAEKTNNLLEELWNYIEDGKIIQSAVLLLAAQEQIRGVSSSKINGSSKKNGFEIIEKCITRHSYALRNEKGSLGMAQELLEERKTLNDCAWLLVDVISHAGEDLSAYIQAHSVVSHVEVFQHVSSILKECGFCPTGDLMDTINLQPYDCRKSNGESCKDANMAVMESAKLNAAEKKVTTVGNDGLSLMAQQHTTQTQAVRKKVGGGWDPTYTKRSFFPYWRSVLQAGVPLKVYPAHASSDPRSRVNHGQLHVSLSNSIANGSTTTPNHKLGRTSPLTSNNQPRRCFVTAATGAFRLLKVLK
ncbi:unnamed protein product [Triticum turgidum subsp. durum]|uniref:Uncharacterized protein n=1 Tax=Triticum turgidum subsp. durum TaxID=4567 RepID=A0A9R1NQQ6_TRITD|nr:unnamed protein product [Triticum turgidum subsp. durum]